jgi:hypothetical protein
VQVSKKSTISYTENRRKVKIKTTENTTHGCTSKHDVKVTNNVKSIVEDDVKPDMRNKHTAQTTQHKKIHKSQKK